MDADWQAKVTGLLKWLGLWIGGDLGDFTIYQTKRGQVVWYPRSPPTDPPSSAQQRARARFGLAVRRWTQLDHQTRAEWEALSKQLALDATGHNLYVHLSLNADRDCWQTAVARTRTSLIAPDWIPT